MAFTTTDTHKLTATDIITEAMEILGVLEEGEAPSSAQSTSAIRSLNNVIKMWSADTQIFAQNEYELTLISGTALYVLSSANVGYIPWKILNATLVHNTNSTEIPLSQLTQEEWYALTDKTTAGRPTQYYQKRNPVGVGTDLHLWPVPNNTTYNMKLWIQYPLRDISAGTDDVYFTQEWYLALSFGLAFLLAHKYGVSIEERDRLQITSEHFKDQASSYETDGSVYFQPMEANG